MLKYIDIHSHLNFKAFDENWQAVIKRALDNNTWMINVGTQVDTSKKAVEIAHQYKEGVYAIIGLHPIHTKDPKVLAIGECGLDYFHMEAGSIEKQKKAFIEQIELANEINKPLMLHIRNNPKDKKIDAYVDVLEILKKYSKVKGNVHFFAGSIENAKDFLNYGFTLSFTGVITFTHDYDEIIKNTPLDMIMSETDSPYVAPVPYRGKRNEPSYVKEVVKKIALIKNLPEEEITKAIIANAKRVFRI
ncbi:MAG: Hydrolase, TatD family [Parcubacteria group bacterium GW2011_GWC1_35_21]|nr:MAG: Hydrolase, TatD family [Parcubacteria group bacterium GW2011_GWC1_35_21]